MASGTKKNQVKRKATARGGKPRSKPLPKGPSGKRFSSNSNNANSKKLIDLSVPGDLVVGFHACCEVLKRRPSSVLKFFVRDDLKQTDIYRKILASAHKNNIDINFVDSKKIKKIHEFSQGMALVINNYIEFDEAKIKTNEYKNIVVLDQIEDPHNLGAVLRSVWLMGGGAVIIPDKRSVQLNATVCKVASGGAEHVPVHCVSSLSGFISDMKSKYDFWAWGLSGQAESSLYSFDIPDKVLWILGSEAKGMRKSTEGLCDQLVLLPMADVEASYNVSVSAALCLGESFRQRLKS